MSGEEIGQVQTITDPTNHTTSYGYDAQGNVTTVTDANGHVASESYFRVDGNTRPTGTYTGLLYEVTPPSPLGVTTIKSYDANNYVPSGVSG